MQKLEKFLRSSPFATQYKHHGFVLSMLDDGDFPDIPVKNLMVSELRVVLDNNAYIPFNSLRISENEAFKIKESTRLPRTPNKMSSESYCYCYWGRITTVVAGDIVKRRKGMLRLPNYKWSCHLSILNHIWEIIPLFFIFGYALIYSYQR